MFRLRSASAEPSACRESASSLFQLVEALPPLAHAVRAGSQRLRRQPEYGPRSSLAEIVLTNDRRPHFGARPRTQSLLAGGYRERPPRVRAKARACSAAAWAAPASSAHWIVCLHAVSRGKLRRAPAPASRPRAPASGFRRGARSPLVHILGQGCPAARTPRRWTGGMGISRQGQGFPRSLQAALGPLLCSVSVGFRAGTNSRGRFRFLSSFMRSLDFSRHFDQSLRKEVSKAASLRTASRARSPSGS